MLGDGHPGDDLLLKMVRVAAIVEGEAEHMVVALGAGEPFDGSDQVTRVGRIYADVRLRVVLRQGGRAGCETWVAADLRGIRSECASVLTRVRARAGGFPAEAVVGAGVGRVRDLRPVAAGLRRGVHILYAVGLEALGVGPISPGCGRRRDRERRDQDYRYGDGDELEPSHTNPPEWRQADSTPEVLRNISDESLRSNLERPGAFGARTNQQASGRPRHELE